MPKGISPTLETRKKLSKALIGIKRNPFSAEHRKKLSNAKVGKIAENSNSWKGDSAGYRAVHLWLCRTYGQPETCEECGAENLKGHSIQWANKSGKYLRERQDWERLCCKCHGKKYKRTHNKLRKEKYESK